MLLCFSQNKQSLLSMSLDNIMFLHHYYCCLVTDILHLIYQVLHMDRNDYYGGESTSLNLIQVYVVKMFCKIFDTSCNSQAANNHVILLINYLFTALDEV